MKISKNFKVAMIGLSGTRWLGNRLLHAVLEREGFEVFTIFFRETFETGSKVEEIEYQYVMQAIEEINPNLVGISLTSLFAKSAKEITSRIKDKHDIPVIWGGIHPTMDPEGSLKHADMVCRGEGEEPLTEVAFSIKNGDERTDIKNIWFKRNGSIIKNELRPARENLDSLPFADVSDTKKYYIVGKNMYKEYNPSVYYKYEYNILTGRGCPYKCTYCGSHVTNRLAPGKVLRRRSVGDVMDELRKAVKDFPNLRKIFFWDDILTYDKVWLRALADEYIRDIPLPFFCYVHPNMVDEERVSILKKMGIDDVAIGFQHGSHRIRKDYFGRPESNDAIIKATSLLHDQKIRTHVDMISTPFDNEQDNYDNIALLLKLPKPFSLAMHTLTFFHGYKITERALKEKVITKDQIVGEDFQDEAATTSKEISENVWLSYECLLGKRHIPNGLVNYMINTKFHDKYSSVLKFLALSEMKIERITVTYENNIKLLKNLEVNHFKLMFKYVRLLFKRLA